MVQVWYGVPAHASSALEDAMKDALPDLFEAAPDLMYSLVTMVSPTNLQVNQHFIILLHTLLCTISTPELFFLLYQQQFYACINSPGFSIWCHRLFTWCHKLNLQNDCTLYGCMMLPWPGAVMFSIN